jgi:hypothetical protein
MTPFCLSSRDLSFMLLPFFFFSGFFFANERVLKPVVVYER